MAEGKDRMAAQHKISMTDSSTAVQRILTAEPLRHQLMYSMIQTLALPLESRGLDAGCGIGLQALLLADAVGAHGNLTGLDLAFEQLDYGRQNTKRAAYSERISFCQGDLNRLPFSDDAFDWVWSADCIGYPAGELASIFVDLIRIVRPGGKIFLLAWTSQQLLPGYPLLEGRLNATCSAYLPYLHGVAAEQNFMRAMHWMQEAGLVDIEGRTFVADVQAPLNRDERLALASLFEMLWGMPQPGVSPEDWQEFQRLCHPGSPDYILDLPDYYAFFTYSLFQGKVPEE
jgi:ubiquinone/menaquinone biosynthesis C-methylase UbiE